MRIARVTYKGAYHHVMNRGIEGKNIFPDDKAKQYFLNILCDKSRNLKIRLLARCVMDSHYHLTLQNSSGRLSDFMEDVRVTESSSVPKTPQAASPRHQDCLFNRLVEQDGVVLCG